MIASEALKKAGDKPAAAKKRVVEVSYAVGDQVTVIDGPFATMAAVVSDVEPTTQKLTRAGFHLRARHAGGTRLPSGGEASVSRQTLFA